MRLGRFAVTRRSSFGVRFAPPALTVWRRGKEGVWHGYIVGRKQKVRGSFLTTGKP